MEKIIKLYSYVDGINDTPFPSNDNQIESEDFQYNAKRMGGTPSISVSLYWPECIDKSWAYNVYARFNGERYFLKQLPTSGKDNTDARYKYDIELVSERIILDNVYVYDVVSPDSDYDKPVSNGSKFTFFGTIHEFARRLNYSLEYCKVGYSVVVDDGISSDGKMVSFEDQFFSNAIQEAYNTYEIPYYFVGKVIHIGFTNNAITETFKYGAENSLMSIQKQNANYKIVTRVTGTGSSDNIPSYYPNDSADRAAIEAAGGTWILPSDKLMPPVYRDTFGRERFYNAKNNTYTSPQTGDYYHFDNEYVEGNPKEHIVNFENIKPSIVGMTNSLGFRIDKFVDFAYDTNDNDDVDEEGNYIHPYFFAKLRKMDGDYGFNLFEHAIEGNDMTISMTGGSCGACEWTIMVDEDTMKNTVQVDSDGNILRDENGNVKFGEAQDRQNDTKNYEVWIALKKDIDTFGVVMPNASSNYKPSTDDTFVILHINLPKAYILAAENKLMEEMIKYMAANNNEKFNFSIKFSRIYLEEHPDVLSKLNENARIQIEYDGATVELYVSSFSYKASKSDILPEITVELSDTLTISQNALQTAINDVKQDIMSNVGSIDWLKLGLAYFLRRDTNDRTRGRLSSDVGFEVGRYVSGASGAIVYVDKSTGQTIAELDKLYVRMKAYFEQLEIININSVGGKQILSPAGAIKCNAVEDKGDFYRCYFLAEQDGEKIENRFKSGDQAICKMFNAQTGVSNKISNTYYWRLVTGVGDNYIDLSKADCDTGSDEPKAGDVICHKGNRNDTDRQNVIELSSVDAFSPSITLYQGINSYSLVDKEVVQFGVDKTTGKSFMHVYGDMYVGNRDGSSYIKYSPETGVEIKGSLGVGTKLGGKDLSQLITDASNNYKEDLESFQNAVNVSIEGLQGQIDGAIETWFYEPVPTLTNAPALSWTTDADRNKHLGDLYYSGDGRAYRFQYDDTQKTYYWNEIVDTAIVTALENAKKAQDTADGKRRVFIQQPTASDTYDIGDMWVNATYGTTYKNDMLRAKAAKQAGVAFSISHWTLASKYTDDTVANNAKAAADKAQSDVNSLSGTVSGMKDFTDTAFADGVIDRSEKTAIEKYLKQVETVKAQVSKSYTELYANSLLQGTYKTNLKTGHDAFVTSATELVNTINTAIDDGKTTTSEKAQVDAKYDTFNSKYGDYVKYLNAAINSIEQALNTSITSYAYLKEALKEDTSITGGLVQTTALVLGYTSSGTYKVMAGSNGYVGGSGEKTIAIWAGGEMVDRELSGSSDLTNAADFLVRMDGSGYAASGKLSWNTAGKVTADPLSFFVGENTVGALLASFQVVLKSDGKSPDYIVPQVPFSSLTIANHLALGDAMLKYDAKNNAVYVVKEDGSAVNFYATGGISMYGSGDVGGGGGGITIVDGLTSTMTDAALSANMGRVLKEMIDSKSTVTTWEQLQNKPSWIGSSKPSYSYSELTGKPTTIAGFGITDAPTKTGAGASGTWAISISGKAAKAAQIVPEKYTGNLNSATSSYFGKLLYAGGDNPATNKPAGVDAYGMAVIRTADGYTGQLLMSANAATGLYWRTAANASLGAWNKVLDSANYNDYAPTKTGGGASGTWGISIKGNAATASKLTNLTSIDAASSSATWRRVWMSYNDNVNGRPAYSDSLAYQTSTNTLKAPNLSCTTSVSIGGIVLSVKDGNLYIDGNVVTSGGVTMYGDGSTSGGSGGGGNVTIVDGLTSTMTDAALSANQGRVLNESINAFKAEADGKYLTAHQTIYNLTFAAGAFAAKTFDPNGAAATVNIPQKLTHLTNNLFVNGTQTAATNAWTGTVDGLKAYYDGLTIDYRLPYAGTSSAATLNLNGLGAKTVYNGRKGSTTTHYVAGSIIRLTYYGGAFYADAYYDSNTTYSGFVCGYCSTAAATAAKTASATNFALTSGVTVLIRFTAANTSKSALTLNVNSTGAKTVYINGTASSSSNYTLPAGTYPCHYDGTYWHVYTNGMYRFANVTAGTFYGSLSGNASTASKWQTARTLTLTGSVTGSASIDGSGNVSLATSTNHTHPYLPLAGGTMTGSIKSGYASGTWINGVTNACLSGTYTTYGAIASLPVKSGRVSISTYPSSTNLLYFGYASSAQINAGTNSLNQQMTWDAVNNKLTAASLAASSTLTVDGIAITKSADGVLKIDGDLIVTGGITMYATDGVASGIMDQILVDGITIAKDENGRLYAVNTGNVRSIIMGTTTYGPDDSGTITLPSSFAPLSHTHAIADVTNLQSALNGKSATSHTHSVKINGTTKTIAATGGTAVDLGTYLTAHQTVTLASGTNNGTLKLTVGGTVTDNIAVKGLGSAAYTNSSAYSAASHTHTLKINGSTKTIAATGGTAVDLGSYLPLSGGTMTGNLILKGGTSADMTYAGNVHPSIRFDNSDSSQNVSLIFTDYDTYRAPAGLKLVGSQGNEWFESANIYATTFHGALSGNAATATKLAVVKTLWGQSFDGSANVSGNMSGVGQITFSALTGTNGRAVLYQQMADNDYFRIYVGATASNAGYAEIATADDGNEPIYVRQYTGVFGTVKRTLTLLDASGNTTVPGTLTMANGKSNGTMTVSGNTTVGSLTVGGINVTKSATGVLKIDGNLIVTGGITMYSDGTGGSGSGGAGSVTIVDGLTSTDASAALSANQGRILKGMIDGKSDSGHTHPYLPLSGGTMTGALNFKNGTWNLVGDDAYIGDCNVGGMIGVKAANAATPGLVFYNNSGTLLGKLYANGGELNWSGGTIKATTFSGNASTASLLALNTSPASTVGTAVGSWSPIGDKVYVYRQRWTNTASGGDTADLSIYLDGNLTANMCLDGYYWSMSGFKKEGSSNSYVLLGGGSHKALSDFSMAHTHPYLPLAGGTMTGVLSLLANQYTDGYNGALNCNNSDIYGLNSIYTADLSGTQAEGIHFYRTASTVDTFRIKNGVMYFAPNRTLGGTATEYTVMHSGNYSTWAAAKSHTHSYLPLSGGELSGNLSVNGKVATTAELYTSGYVYSNSGWFQNNAANRGLYNAAGDARFYYDSSVDGWRSDKGIIAIDFSATNAVNTSVLTATNGANDLYVMPCIITAPNLTNTHCVDIVFGKYNTKYNCGYIGYVHTSDGASSNYLTLGLHSQDRVINLTASGNTGIGTIAPEAKLHVHNTAYPNIKLTTGDQECSIYYENGWGRGWAAGPGCWGYPQEFVIGEYKTVSAWRLRLDASGNLLVAGGITMYSDLRKKTAIENVELRLDEIADAPLFSHIYKDDGQKTLHVGSSAQYWDALCPGWFTREDTDGYYMMEIQNCALAAAISLGREVRRYESKTDKQIRKLKRRIAELEEQIEEIKNTNQQNNA